MDGWMAEHIKRHQTIRDDLVDRFRGIEGRFVRTPEAVSNLFPSLPRLTVPTSDFVSALRLVAGVTVTPGTEFSRHSADSVRLNFSEDHVTAVSAVERLATLVE